MRILSIRGQNLASLEASFDIDLTGGALGRAGLFAITGPTGAGKSTLLDAMCLCLYDKTPRLAQRGGATVVLAGQSTDGALPAHDQRNLLRRGAGSAWAEVDFSGRDGQRWTARWEVRRARGRADGRVQGQSVTLRSAQGQVVGGTKSETLDAIRKRVGLDFDQFRRSVMLAQGDFAAFLRADQNERAELLEQMTDTGIYTRLSQAAFFKKKELDGQRRDLETRRDAQGVLAPDARAAAQAVLTASTTQRSQAIAAVAAAEAAVRWHVDQAALQAGLVAARTQLQAADQAWAAAARRRQDLEKADRGWALRTLAGEAQQATKLAAEAQTRDIAAQQRQARADADHQDAVKASATAQARLVRARQALVEQLQGRRAAAKAGLEDAQTWLAAHPQHLRMADPERLQQIADRLDERAQRRAALTAATAGMAELDAALARAVAQVTSTTAARAEAEASEERATTAVQTAVQAAARHDDSELLRQRRELDLHQRALAELQRLADRADELAADRDRAVGDQEAARARLDTASAGALEAGRSAAALAPRIDEARTALQRARAAVDATSLRAALEDDQPCPVCGSSDHPWADGSPVAQLHDQQQARVQQLEQDLAGLQAAVAAHQATAAAESNTLAAATKAAAQAAAPLAALGTPWQVQAAALGQPDLAGPLDAQHTLRSTEAALLLRVEALSAREAAARSARQAVEAARVRQQLAQGNSRKAVQAAVQADKQASAAQTSLDKAAEARAQDRARIAQLEAELGALLDPAAEELAAVADWRQTAQGVLAACRAAATAWKHHSARRDAAAAAIETLDQRLPRDMERAELAARDALTEDLAMATMAAPAPGLAPPDTTAWLDDQIAQRTAALERSRTVAAQAEAARITAAQTATAASAAAATLAQQASGAQARLDAQRTAKDLSSDDLTALLALPDGWLETERAALRQLDDAPAVARTLLAERQQRADQHAPSRPDADADAAREELARCTAAQAAADEAWSAARAVLQADDGARTRVADLQQQLATHTTRAEPWLKLAACIGSGSGVEFKRFAQSLTLEALLEQANRHLHQLHPRYSLARIHGTDLDILIIDHDLGDEPRTIQSLSGGESFLTSLALALGLSSLSSRDVRVESLFIDEGFGTLDARTLDTALAVLDSLQAAGRQVGVISHVGGLAERIGVQIKITPLGGGRSSVTVVAG